MGYTTGIENIITHIEFIRVSFRQWTYTMYVNNQLIPDTGRIYSSIHTALAAAQLEAIELRLPKENLNIDAAIAEIKEAIGE